jgi:hypothetical protein
MAIKLDIKLENKRIIEKNIRDAIIREYRNIFKNATVSIKEELAPIFIQAVLADPLIQELVNNGILNAHLGLSSPKDAIDEIIREWADNIVVTGTLVRSLGGKAISGSLFVGMVVSDYSDVLGNPAAQYRSDPSGEIIPWLSWMIDSDSKAIVVSYDIKFGSDFRVSRSGQAVMKKANKSWTLPRQYGGSFDDNFVTRALSTIDEQVCAIIIKNLI